MKYIKIKRFKYQDKQTLGVGKVISDCNPIYEFKTLELPWKNNERNISCIPPGTYIIKKHYAPHLKQHCFLLYCVKNRSEIMVHAGNFYTDIKGCVLVGESFIDINADGYKDVTNSKVTLRHILKLVDQDETFLVIEDE